MPSSSYPQRSAFAEEPSARSGALHGNAPSFLDLAVSAGNDGTYAEQVERIGGYEGYREATRHRAIALREIVAAALAMVRATSARTLAYYRRHRHVAATYATLSELDDRVLHDLGFDRSELGSVAAEVAGLVECTRVRAGSQFAS